MGIRANVDQEAGEAAQLGGSLDPDQVQIQFLCTTTDGGHDPDGTPDDAVRPHHAALHGTIWRLDDPTAPFAPLDFGCRCAIRYVAKEGTQGAAVLGEEATVDDAPETGTKDSFSGWLDGNVPGWQSIAKVASEAAPQDRLRLAYLEAKRIGAPNPRDVARMAVEASPYPMKPLGPLGTGPLSGVGAAGRALVNRFLAGDVEAGLKLQKSYPATFARIIAERGIPPPRAPGPVPPTPKPKPAPKDQRTDEPAKKSTDRDQTPAVLKKIDAVAEKSKAERTEMERKEAEAKADADAKLAIAKKAIADSDPRATELIREYDVAAARHVESIRAQIDQVKRTRELMHAELVVENPTTAQFDIQATNPDVRRNAGTAIAFLRKVIPAGIIDNAKYTVAGTRKRRSFFLQGVANISSNSDVGTNVHEIAHGLEFYNPSTFDKADAFRARRTAGNPLVKLRKLTGNKNYKSHEVARLGGFESPYVGKFYPNGQRNTEIISMGVEYLYNDPESFRQKDPDYFNFIVNLIRGN